LGENGCENTLGNFCTPALYGCGASGFQRVGVRALPPPNMENLMSGFSFVAILAMGRPFHSGARHDLSIGAIVGLVGMVVFDLALIFTFRDT
jgi:ABC-type xylose transport system permease subunit